MVVSVHWNRERITFQLPPPDTLLGALRDSLAEYTRLPPDAFKLIHNGAIMKDNSAPISAYGLHENSTIALIGATNQPPTGATSQSEQSIVNFIRHELDHVRSTLTPDVHAFLSAPHEKEHNRLGELLLQSLLRLDSVSTEPAWDTARLERKLAVREVQALLDSLDSLQ
ncbi:hypothetical protein BD779DRAFT_1669512 [Infundibulicybe gibba]|nr:hypothetical protein BD779DRAFT_1669512 [Infundibulicybe gibba]